MNGYRGMIKTFFTAVVGAENFQPPHLQPLPLNYPVNAIRQKFLQCHAPQPAPARHSGYLKIV